MAAGGCEQGRKILVPFRNAGPVVPGIFDYACEKAGKRMEMV